MDTSLAYEKYLDLEDTSDLLETNDNKVTYNLTDEKPFYHDIGNTYDSLVACNSYLRHHIQWKQATYGPSMQKQIIPDKPNTDIHNYHHVDLYHKHQTSDWSLSSEQHRLFCDENMMINFSPEVSPVIDSVMSESFLDDDDTQRSYMPSEFVRLSDVNPFVANEDAKNDFFSSLKERWHTEEFPFYSYNDFLSSSFSSDEDSDYALSADEWSTKKNNRKKSTIKLKKSASTLNSLTKQRKSMPNIYGTMKKKSDKKRRGSTPNRLKKENSIMSIASLSSMSSLANTFQHSMHVSDSFNEHDYLIEGTEGIHDGDFLLKLIHGNDGTTQSKKARNVDKACNHCKRSHLRCDYMRPCNRCVTTGKTGCQDVEHKPRGRPKLAKNT